MNVWVSDHAADRFVERVRPSLGRKAAALELARLLREFGRRVEWPDWGHDYERGEKGRYCVEVSDGIVVVVDPVSAHGSWPLAVTVLTRAGHTESHLGRKQRRRQQRQARSYRKRLERKLDPTSRARGRMPEADEAA